MITRNIKTFTTAALKGNSRIQLRYSLVDFGFLEAIALNFIRILGHFLFAYAVWNILKPGGSLYSKQFLILCAPIIFPPKISKTPARPFNSEA